MKRIIRVAGSAIIILGAVAVSAAEGGVSSFSFELEGSYLWQTVNDIQIPNDANGTRFSLVDLAGKGPYPAVRAYVTWRMNEKHRLRVLLAPFEANEEISPTAPVLFEGENFSAGTPTDATYKFNSWRVSYIYAFHSGHRARWNIGFTAKIRDAKIELSQGGTSSRKTDVGFVPLLHLSGDIDLAEKWILSLDLDALAGGPGRAEDFSVKLRYDMGNGWGISAGYRTLEGGADVDEVYNFAWLHYACLSVSYGY